MPASDKIHQPVRNALVKDGWTITDDPYRINIEGEFLYADLRAQKEFADQTLHVIVVEIKSFGERSLIYALEKALGQIAFTAKFSPGSSRIIAFFSLCLSLRMNDCSCVRPSAF